MADENRQETSAAKRPLKLASALNNVAAHAERLDDVSAPDSGSGSGGRRALGVLLPLFVFALTLGLTLVSWHLTKTAEFKQVEQDFHVDVERVRTAVEERMRTYEQVLLGGVGLFAASDHVSRQEWATYVESLHLPKRYPGIQGVGFSKVLMPEALPDHTREIRAEGFPGYRVWPVGERDLYTAIIYLEPFDPRNQRAFGYDMFSEPMRRSAMERARDTGRASVSGRVILVQETDEDVQAGFLTYLPLYRKGAPLHSLEDRREALLGYVYSPFRMNDFMDGILGNLEVFVTLRIHDGAERSDNTLMFVSHDQPETPLFHSVVTTELSGREWTLEIASLPHYEARLTQARSSLILLAGVVISLLLTAFTWLIANLRNRAVSVAHKMTAALQHSEHQFRTAIDHSAVGTALITNEGKWLRVNQALLNLLGYTEAELKALNKRDITHPDDHDRRLRHRIANGAVDIHEAEERYLRKDGSWVWAQNSASVIRHADGSPQHIICQITDITDRKAREDQMRDLNEELELRVQRRTAELESANDEIAAFSYSVSHDLRAPLRSIHGFTQALSEDFGDTLDDDGKDYLRRVCSAAQYMERLIDDMLNLSRLSRSEIELENVNVSEQARAIVARLQEADADRKVSVDIESDLVAFADPRQIRIALTNLISNAWKYSGKVDEARLEIGQVEGTQGAAVFFVRDNGVGFDMAYADKMFTPFQRLHSDKDFEGSGIGLATTERIVRRHGGQIWAESEPGKGATFFFTLSGEAQKAA